MQRAFYAFGMLPPQQIKTPPLDTRDLSQMQSYLRAPFTTLVEQTDPKACPALYSLTNVIYLSKRNSS
jgi:hypothetical protein